MANRELSSGRLCGIVFMIAAVFIFSIMDALMKRLSAHYGPLQIACLRSLASLLCLLPPLAWRRSGSSLRALRTAAPCLARTARHHHERRLAELAINPAVAVLLTAVASP